MKTSSKASETTFIKNTYYLELFLFLFLERASSLPAEERKDYAERVSCFHYTCVSGILYTLYTFPSANSSTAKASQFLTSELNLRHYLLSYNVRQAIGLYDDILTTEKKRKLKWFGHVSRSSGLAKTILQGTVQEGRRRGRQKKRWENNISEWTGLKFCNAVREAENKIKWRERVAMSVAPQRSLTTG